MALIKCVECGKEISDKAVTCPSCGNPNQEQGTVLIDDKKHPWRMFVNFIILTILIGGYFFIQYKISHYSGVGTFIGNVTQDLTRGDGEKVFKDIFTQQANQPSKDNSKQVSLQEVSNLGYTFYLGQIDTSNTAIGDDIKTEITKIAYNAKFPKNLLKDTPIVIVNSLAIKPELFITTESGNFNVIDFGPQFLYEGGIYATYGNNKGIIYINKTTLEKGLLTDVLTHELGHVVGSTLTDEDWKKYYELRNIPTGTVRSGGLWNLSPAEDFAEVYKNTFTGLGIKTYYGILLPVLISSGFDMGTCGSIYMKIYQFKSGQEDTANSNGEVQACRRDVMIHPEKHHDDFVYGVPYQSSVGPKTKEFINKIMSGLN